MCFKLLFCGEKTSTNALSLSEMSGNCSTSTWTSLNQCIAAILCVSRSFRFCAPALETVLGIIMYSSTYLWRVDLPFHSVLPQCFLFLWTLIHDLNVPELFELVFLCRLGWKYHTWPWFVRVILYGWMFSVRNISS